MKIACYKGKSGISRVIRFLTRSEYSHAAFVFDEDAQSAAMFLKLAWNPRVCSVAAGAVVEAWDSGVRNVTSISSQHTPGTPVDIFEFVTPLGKWAEAQLLTGLLEQLGKPYAFRDVLRFVTRRPGRTGDGRWFCSELVFAMCVQKAGRRLLERTEPWEVPPGWIPRSPLLKLSETVVTV